MKLMNMNDIKPIERDDLIWNKENELFKLLGVTDEKQSEQILTLPVNQSLEQADIEKIISTINRFFSN